MEILNDEVIACPCGYDDVSFPHSCLAREEYKKMERGMDREFKKTPHGAIKALHEIVGMVHAAMILTEEDQMKELLGCMEGQIDSLIEGLEI